MDHQHLIFTTTNCGIGHLLRLVTCPLLELFFSVAGGSFGALSHFGIGLCLFRGLGSGVALAEDEAAFFSGFGFLALCTAGLWEQVV